MSSEDDEFPNDPEERLFLGGGAGLPANTGLLNIGGDVAFCDLKISDGLKFPFSVLESKECFFTGPLGINKCSECGLVGSIECFLATFNWGGGMLGFGGLIPLSEYVTLTGRRVGGGVEWGDIEGDTEGLARS